MRCRGLLCAAFLASLGCATWKYDSAKSDCRKDEVACERQGYYAYKLGKVDEGRTLLSTACVGGSPRACEWLEAFDSAAATVAREWAAAGVGKPGVPFPKTKAEEQGLLQRGCNNHHAESCVDLSHRLVQSGQVVEAERMFNQGIQLLILECRSGGRFKPSCNRLFREAQQCRPAFLVCKMLSMEAEREKAVRGRVDNPAFASTFQAAAFGGGVAGVDKGASGSGFVVCDSGVVATNNHVVAGAREIELRFPDTNETTTAKVVMRDEQNDLALVVGDRYRELAISKRRVPYALAGTSSLGLGETVYSLGFPLGEDLGETAKLYKGSVSALVGLHGSAGRMQVSTPIQPGNSGGPLFDEHGRVIGVMVAKINDLRSFKEEGFVAQNVAFAVKSEYLSNLLTVVSKTDKTCIKMVGPTPKNAKTVGTAVNEAKPFAAFVVVH